MKIFRKTIDVQDERITLELPWPWTILSTAAVRTGEEAVDIWFVDPERETDDRTILGFADDGSLVRAPATETVIVHIAGTGHHIPEDFDQDDFIGTCVMPSNLVWHVFARGISHDEETKKILTVVHRDQYAVTNS